MAHKATPAISDSDQFELPPLEEGIDPGPSDKRWRERITPFLFIAPALVLIGLVFVYPIASGFRTTLYRVTLLNPDGPFVGLDNWEKVLSMPAF